MNLGECKKTAVTRYIWL